MSMFRMMQRRTRRMTPHGIRAAIEFLRPMRFMILGQARCGSNLLRTLLNSHPNVRLNGELFSVSGIRKRPACQADPISYLNNEVFGVPGRQVDAVGFKLFYYHLQQHDGFNDYSVFNPTVVKRILALRSHIANDYAVSILHLTRRNLLRTIVSRELAILKNEWVKRKDGAGPAESQTLILSPSQLESQFCEMREWENEVNQLYRHHRILNIEYETLVANTADVMSEVQAFLGLKGQILKSKLKKQNTRNLRDTITNYDELLERFASTEWSHFFDV